MSYDKILNSALDKVRKDYFKSGCGPEKEHNYKTSFNRQVARNEVLIKEKESLKFENRKVNSMLKISLLSNIGMILFCLYLISKVH